MSKELKIQGALTKDYQQLYVGDEATGIEINNEGRVRVQNLIAVKNVYGDRESVRIGSQEDTVSTIPNPLYGAIGSNNGLMMIYSKEDGSGTILLNSKTIAMKYSDNFSEVQFDLNDNTMKFYPESSGGAADYAKFEWDDNGALTISTVDAAGDDAFLKLDADGYIEIEPLAGSHILMDGSVGFTQLEPTYNASDTAVDFRASNKQFVTFGAGNIADLNLQFPLVSGNFVLLLKQDGTGSRTVAADGWLVFDSAGNAAAGSATVKFAGGSNPTLTTDANHVDIISFYWDADNEIAYGVATLDFQF